MLVLVLDQFTKILILGQFAHGDAAFVTPYFNVVRVHNAGAAFSFLAQASGWQRWFFTALGLGAVTLMLTLLWQHRTQKLFALSMALLIGGALGNVIDRLWLGYVVDFLDFHWRDQHFPAFNVADMAISVGAAFLILDELLRVRRSRST